jgi:hypothetical protein
MPVKVVVVAWFRSSEVVVRVVVDDLRRLEPCNDYDLDLFSKHVSEACSSSSAICRYTCILHIIFIYINAILHPFTYKWNFTSIYIYMYVYKCHLHISANLCLHLNPNLYPFTYLKCPCVNSCCDSMCDRHVRSTNPMKVNK